MNSVGSIWQKWDLHIHTPASFHWQGAKFSERTSGDCDATCKAILEKMDGLDVVAFCIMDYWTFDGYLMLRDYIERHPGEAKKKIFPGIELRMAAPTDFRLNTHVLLNDEVASENLAHFISHLKLADTGSKPPTRQHLIELGRSYDSSKLRLHGCTPADKANEEKMYELGLMSALVTRDSVVDAIKLVGEENCLVVQPYDTSNGLEELDWQCHPYTDSYLMKWADCFETRKEVHVDLFLGNGHPTKADVGPQFIDNLGGVPKPVFSGSDAHRVADYGNYPNDRITWLKAQPTFRGLKQVCCEPALRCHIGVCPPKLDHIAQNPTKYMKMLTMEKVTGSTLDEHWFHGGSIELNPGLIAIIGNKGSGKSALADILALVANSHCTEMEFLNDKRFCATGNKAAHFNATLNWSDDTSVTIRLDQKSDLRKPERVRYLPQHFIERLCNEIAIGNETNFGKELKKVIFAHVPTEKQLRMGTLDDLLEYRVASRKKAFSQIQQKLFVLNEDIVRVEGDMSEDTLRSYETALDLKESELEAHEAARPNPVDKPVEDANDATTEDVTKQLSEKHTELKGLQEELSAAKAERAELTAHEALLARLIGYIQNFEDSYATFVADYTAEFDSGGFNLADIVKVTVDRTTLEDAVETSTNRLAELATLIEGTAATDTAPATNGLESQEAACHKTIKALSETLKAPQKAYQAYLLETANWEARKAAIVGSAEKAQTIEYYRERIKLAKDFLPTELAQLMDRRRQLVRELHAELVAIRETHEELYRPVQKIASEAEVSDDPLQLEFDAFLAPVGFEENFLDFIHRNRRGSFYGDEESRKTLHGIMQAHDFNLTDSVVDFVDALMKALTGIDHDGKWEHITIQSQLRDKKKLSRLYDYIFGLDYLEPRYTLRLSGKDISQLSPGEKGALLLVFYLLLDTEEIPIIIDQPEQNLDNESVVRLLVDCIRRARSRRQVMIVTHNPNLAVFCDADQVIYCAINKTDGNRISYATGAIEDYPINKMTVDVLEGTFRAFRQSPSEVPKALDRPRLTACQSGAAKGGLVVFQSEHRQSRPTYSLSPEAAKQQRISSLFRDDAWLAVHAHEKTLRRENCQPAEAHHLMSRRSHSGKHSGTSGCDRTTNVVPSRLKLTSTGWLMKSLLSRSPSHYPE